MPVTPAQRLWIVVVSGFLAGTAHADPGSLNPDAFDLSGALDRDVAPTRPGFELVIGAGYTQGVGGAGMIGSVEDLAGPGGHLEAQLAVRTSARFSVGAYGTLARFRRGDLIPDGDRAFGATAGVQAVWHSRESRALDPWIGVGTGWRGLWRSPMGAPSSSEHGLELLRLQLGIDYRISPALAVTPMIGASVSLFVIEGSAVSDGLSQVHDNRLNFYGFSGLLGRFDLGG